MTELYLHLFHGRADPDEEMDDWGFDGPEIGPLNYVHTTYGTDVKICFTSAEVEQRFFRPPTQYPDSQTIPMISGMLQYEGNYYGDWSAHIERSP